ncbi:hypothetical protein BJ095_11433 [Ureibacillus chungkukjangi]|uniref:Uncharacterized protein n=1 Tax=Ureibacillus chungkukjangi TaxID=1202712 RepID=A0A318TMH6_9BACL|nr:hypothetical protein BJ095_11433 [Ureibacillus chungkukjangi]
MLHYGTVFHSDRRNPARFATLRTGFHSDRRNPVRFATFANRFPLGSSQSGSLCYLCGALSTWIVAILFALLPLQTGFHSDRRNPLLFATFANRFPLTTSQSCSLCYFIEPIFTRIVVIRFSLLPFKPGLHSQRRNPVLFATFLTRPPLTTS